MELAFATSLPVPRVHVRIPEGPRSESSASTKAVRRSTLQYRGDALEKVAGLDCAQEAHLHLGVADEDLRPEAAVRAEAPIAESQIAARNPPWMMPAGLQKRSSEVARQRRGAGHGLVDADHSEAEVAVGRNLYGRCHGRDGIAAGHERGYVEPMPAGTTVQTLSARHVITGRGDSGPGSVEITGATITAVRPLGSAEPEFEVLAPGFVDIQVNGIGETDVARASGTDWTKLGLALLAQGVTTWCPTLVTAPAADTEDATKRVGAAMSEMAPGMPRIAGVHLEGPYITVPGAHRPEYAIGRVPDGWADGLDSEVRVVTLAPELPGLDRGDLSAFASWGPRLARALGVQCRAGTHCGLGGSAVWSPTPGTPRERSTSAAPGCSARRSPTIASA